jgi:iron(III) transport system substrate-binding protein
VVALAIALGALISTTAVAQPLPTDPTLSSGLQKLIAAAQAEGSVMVYHTADTLTSSGVLKVFEQKYKIKVNTFHATGSPLTVRMVNEGATGTMIADAYYSSDTAAVTEYPHLFQELSEENFPGYDALPEQTKLDNRLAITQTQYSFALMYNTNKVKPADVPRTWLDLGDPKWKGQTLLVDPRSSATYRAAFNEARKHYPDLLSRIAANNPRLAEAGRPAAQQLAAGAASIAFINYASHAFTLIRKGAPIQQRTIEKPEIVRSNWVAATKGPHPNAGRLLIHFLASDDGVKVFCNHTDAKSITDPTGQRTGCQTFAKEVVFLPEAPLSASDSAEVVNLLQLK